MKKSICFVFPFVLLLFTCHMAFAAPATFDEPVNYTSGTSPISVATADFNGDGIQDLAAANQGSNTVSILLGNGNGTFQAKLDYATGDQPFSIKAADFDGDGKQDLAVTNYSSHTVSVLLGNGNGTFQAKADYATGLYPMSVTVGDFNGDGRQDLAVANQFGNSVSILLGNDNGTFQVKVDYDAGNNPSSVTAADFNGDGRQDIAVTIAGVGAVGILIGNGNGTFQAKVVYNIYSSSDSIAVGDFNGDGKHDLVAATDTSASILLGNGNGTFQDVVPSATGSTYPFSVAVGDFNDDGKQDLALAVRQNTNTVSVMLGNGNGTFQTKVDFAIANNPYFIVVADLNADGKLDIAAANQGSASVLILLNASSSNGNGTFQSKVDYATGTSPYSVTTGDFNGDGRQDLATANIGSNTASILLGNGNGTFQAKVDYATGGNPNTVAAGDFNGDGRQDLAIVNEVGNSVSVLLGNGNGTFQAKVDYVTGGTPLSVAVGDFNGDGTKDLAVSSLSGNMVSILLGNGDGTFQAKVDYATGSFPRSVAVGDFNDDGRQDLAAAIDIGNMVSILLGNGNGTFQAKVDYVAGSRPFYVTVADFNGDGRQDLALANYSSNTVSILLGNGNGTFQPKVDHAAGTGPVSVTAGDFNGDGKQDLAATNLSSATVSVLLGNGDSTFQAKVDYATGANPYSVTAGDFNGDGVRDLAVANSSSSSNTVSILLGNSTTSAPTVTTGTATSITSTTATLNGTVSSNGSSTTVTFNYGLTTGYGSTVTASQSPLASDASGTSVSGTVAGLTCNTIYHFRVVGVSGDGTANGGDTTFTTAACPDTTPPVITLASSLTGLTRLTSATLTYGTTEGTVTLTRNGTAISVASGGTLTLLEGRNTVIARATDAAGNVGTAQVVIDVDTLMLAPSIDALLSLWNLPTYTLTGRMENGATVTVTPPAGASAGTVSYPSASSWSCTVTGLTAGSKTFSVTATDAAGNQSSAATATLLVDLGLPPQVTGLSATDTYQGGTVLVSWSGYAYPAAGYALYVAPAPFTSVADLTPWRTYAAGTSSATVTGLADGQTAYLAVVAIGSGGQFIGTVICTPIVPTRQGLYGTVRDYVRNFPLNGMYVQVDGYPAASTGIDGRYVLTGLPAGSYSVTIGEIGGDVRYTTRSYSGVTVSAGQMLAKELYIFSKTHNLDCGVPTNLSAVSGDGKVRLTWDPLTAADLAGYFILRDGVQLNATPLAATSYVDMAVVNGTTYAYTIYSYSRGNIPSDPSPTVLATPLAASAPPVDLRASLGCDGRVTLNWLRPAASDVLGYNVYQQAGTGMDYGSFAVLVGADTTTWTSEVLAGGSYTLAVRSVGSSGEEQNTHVVVTVGVPVSWNQPRAAIVIPQTGKRVDGNALHVQAQEVAPACGVVATASVRFQYRPAGGNWLDIPSALAQYPNPDLTAPFFTKWDITGLSEGNYDLRAVASASSASDPEPGFISVIVDHHQPQLAETRSSDNSSAARGAVERGRVSVASNGQAEVTFAPGSLEVDTTLTLTSLPPERLPAGSGTLLAIPVDLSLASGQSTFAAGSEVGVGLPYIDADNDGVIDGSGFFVTDVELVAYNEQTQTWEALPGAGVDLQDKQVLGKTTHFSLFGTRGKSGLPQSAGVGVVYQPASSSTGNYQLSWSRSATPGRIYEVQQADDADFTQNLTSLYSGPSNYVNVSNAGNGDRYYRIRVVAPGHGPSAWKAGSSPVSVVLTCGAPGVLYAPTTSSTGTFQLSWSRSNIPAVSYDLEVDDGRGFQYLGRTSNNYLNLSGIPGGSYVYRVKATKAGYADSGWKPAPALTVALACGTPGALYAPTASTTGSYQLSWSRSNITGSTYVLEESKDGGAYVTVYSGPNNYANLSGKGSGSYVYRVKALKAGYADSGWKPAPLLTVALTCGTPGALYAPTASSTGSYQLSWSLSNVTGSTYVLEESKNGGSFVAVYSGPTNYINMSGKTSGSYVYRVKATKTNYADSNWKTSGTLSVQ